MSIDQTPRTTLNINLGVIGINGIPIAIPNTFLKRLRLFFQILFRGLPIRQFPQAKALLLAGGTSDRWVKSIGEPHDQGLPKECPEPDPLPSPHKACAPLLGQSPIQRALISFKAHGIQSTLVSVPQDSASPSCKAIGHHIDPYKNPLFMKIDEIPSSINIVKSLRNALDRIHLDSQEHIIAAYSDIIWPVTMMNNLIDTHGDIAVLVDTTWNIYNYPDYRVWHDKTYAELVYGREGKLEHAGEVVSCFPPDSDHDLSLDDSISLTKLFTNNQLCIGEVVGVFKFSNAGREKFIHFYDQTKLAGDDVPMPDFSALCDTDLTSVELLKSKPLDRVLVACFLAHIERMHPGTVELVPVRNCRWFEIDHWGDACITDRELLTWDGYSGESY